MLVVMLTESDSIVDPKAQFWVLRPLENMMRFDVSKWESPRTKLASGPLTFPVVALVHNLSPYGPFDLFAALAQCGSYGMTLEWF